MAEEDFHEKDKESGSDKDFGLPKVEITPIHPPEDPKPTLVPLPPKELAPKVQPEPTKTPEKVVKGSGKEEKHPEMGDRKKGRSWTVWLLVLLILGIGAWFYFNESGNGTQNQVSEEGPSIQEKTEQPLPPASAPVPDEAAAEPVEEITLTEISSRAELPRYFVVVGSFIDDDLARDYSQELNQQGLNTFLIQPYGDIAFSRLSIGHFETFNSAVREMNRIKADFGENLWVLKY